MYTYFHIVLPLVICVYYPLVQRLKYVRRSFFTWPLQAALRHALADSASYPQWMWSLMWSEGWLGWWCVCSLHYGSDCLGVRRWLHYAQRYN